ncbi:hypothetical protein C3L33_00153, partial [Rhododendron williamsianum]
MAPNILPLDKLHPQSRNFTIQCMLTEKAIPRQSADSSSHYQRLVFQDAQGNKMQGIIYGDSIEIFAKRLKVYHTPITNAVITRIKERFRFLPNIYQIVVNAKTPVEHIEVDGLSIRTLVYNFTSITALHTKLVPSDVVLEGEDEMLILVFDEALRVEDGVLWISFSGVLNEHMRGFYKGTYMDGGVKKNMAVTQFEAVDARRCFPCWDEPALKATFKITMEVPSELTALSNMPVIHEELHGQIKTVSFEESPIMSTYVVAVVIGSFDYIEDSTADGIKVRAYCPVGESDKGRFALNVAVKSLDLFKK